MASPFDLNHPFFRPVWRRLVVVVFLFGWMGLELWRGDQAWALVSAMLGGFCAYQFFVGFDPD